jgi:hypothetical protein
MCAKQAVKYVYVCVCVCVINTIMREIRRTALKVVTKNLAVGLEQI